MYLILCWSYLNHSLRFVGGKKRIQKKKSHIKSQSQYFGKKSQLDYFPKSFSPIRNDVATKRQCQYKDIRVFIQMAWHLLPCAMMTVTLPISLCRCGPVFKYIILQIFIVFPHMPDIFFPLFWCFLSMSMNPYFLLSLFWTCNL